MPIRSIIIGSASTRGEGHVLFLCLLFLWLRGLYLPLLRDLWDLTEDKLRANRARLPLINCFLETVSLFVLQNKNGTVYFFFAAFPYANQFGFFSKENNVICLLQILAYWYIFRSASYSFSWADHTWARGGCVNQTRTHLTGRLIVIAHFSATCFWAPGGWTLSLTTFYTREEHWSVCSCSKTYTNKIWAVNA